MSLQHQMPPAHFCQDVLQKSIQCLFISLFIFKSVPYLLIYSFKFPTLFILRPCFHGLQIQMYFNTIYCWETVLVVDLRTSLCVCLRAPVSVCVRVCV